MSSHIQRMGGINALALSRDQQVILTVGQEKKVTYVFECECAVSQVGTKNSMYYSFSDVYV